MILGTAGYMSPEQVRGRPADFRSDLFAFGAILYEMLAGRPAFQRGTALETMTAVLREEPPDLPATVPSALDRIVRHCLEKKPEARFHSASDLAFQLETELAERSGTGGRQPVSQAPGRRRAWAPVLVALLLVGVGALLGRWLWHPAAVSLPTFRQLTFRRGPITSARLAPDGATVVYGAAWDGGPIRLFTTRTDSSESTALPLPNADVLAISRAGEMALSLGRRFLGNPFASTGTLAQAALAGGAPREILQNVHQADWAPDGAELAVVRRSGLSTRLEYPIGKVLLSTRFYLDTPRVSPRGDLVAVFQIENLGHSQLLVLDREGHQKLSSRLEGSPQGLAWHPADEEVWFGSLDRQGSTLTAVRMTGEKRLLLRLPGGASLQEVASGGRVLLALTSSRFGISGLGPGETRERDLSWRDFSMVKDLSPDGKTILFDEQGPSAGVYLRGMDGSPAIRLGEGMASGLSPDGKWALTRNPVTGTRVLLPTGPGSSRPLVRISLENDFIVSWFPDGRRILISGEEPGKAARLYERDLAGGRLRPVAPFGFGFPVSLLTRPISPDGRQIAVLDPEGRLWLYPVETGTPRLVPGFLPGDALLRWSSDGRSLFLWRNLEAPLWIYRLDLATGERRLLREIKFLDPVGVLPTNLMVTPDGSSYVYTYGRFLSTLYLVEGVK
jgi:Tol biopolymer transport system component